MNENGRRGVKSYSKVTLDGISYLIYHPEGFGAMEVDATNSDVYRILRYLGTNIRTSEVIDPGLKSLVLRRFRESYFTGP